MFDKSHQPHTWHHHTLKYKENVDRSKYSLFHINYINFEDHLLLLKLVLVPDINLEDHLLLLKLVLVPDPIRDFRVYLQTHTLNC